ncbi:MAG: hypothetical protein AAF409_04770 [Pseudomonadota bacterium]
MPKLLHIAAGQRSRILWIFSSSIPGDVTFTATPTDGSALSGTVEVHHNSWMGGRQEQHPLTERMVLRKGFWDSDYRVFVTPDQDTEIKFDTRHAHAKTLFVILAIVLALGVISGTTAFLLTP